MLPMEFHDAANLFPLMEGGEFDQLVASIAAKGLIEPIRMHEGKIIDGRNRFRACKKAGVEPRFVAAKVDGSAVDYVLALNLERRHLNESQRAMVAAEAKKLFAKEAKERQKAAGGDHGNQHTGGKVAVMANLPQPPKSPKAARDQAAAALNVSPRSVEHASKVLARAAPELAKAVQAGKVSVSTAARLTALPPIEQRAAATGGKAAVKAAVESLPAKKISQTFFNALKGLQQRIDGIRDQYGTVEEMFNSSVWAGNDTYFVVELVHELAKDFKKLDEEMQEYARTRKKDRKAQLVP